MWQALLGELEKELEGLDERRVELEKYKNEAEEPEREAKDRHQQAWEGESIRPTMIFSFKPYL